MRVGRQGWVLRLAVVLLTLVVVLAGAGSQLDRSGVSYAAPSDPAPMPTPRLGLGLAQVGPILYAIGGSVSGAEESVNTVEAYDTRTNTWMARAPLPTARRTLGSAAATNGKIYAIGGAGPNHLDWETSTVQEYDPSTDSWRGRAPMPTPRYSLGVAAASNGKVYAIGGAGSNFVPLTTVEEYDPATDTWATRKSMPTARRYFAAATGADGLIYAVGGLSVGNPWDQPSAAVEAYDPVTDAWTSRASLPEPRSEHTIVGGSNGTI